MIEKKSDEEKLFLFISHHHGTKLIGIHMRVYDVEECVREMNRYIRDVEYVLLYTYIWKENRIKL